MFRFLRMSLENRLKKVFEESNLSKTDFSKSLSISRQYFNKVLSGSSKPGVEILENIISVYPKFNPSWLLSGKGSMYLNDETNVIVEAEEINNIQEPRPEYAQAGTINTATSVNQFDVRKVIGTNKMLRQFRVIGDSMKPNFVDGMIIYGSPCKSIEEIVERNVYILETHTRGIIIKRLKHRPAKNMIVCVSDNTMVSTFSIYEDEVIGIYRFEAKISFDATDPNTLYHRIGVLEEEIEEIKNRIYKFEEK